MSDPNDPSTWPTPRGPWPPVADPTRLYDHGRQWCINRAAHPDENGGYPLAQGHVPWAECHSAHYFLDDVIHDLDGDPLGLSMYCATRFRFGEPRRSQPEPAATRLVIETWSHGADSRSTRVSVPLGEALQLARIIHHLVDTIRLNPAP